MKRILFSLAVLIATLSACGQNPQRSSLNPQRSTLHAPLDPKGRLLPQGTQEPSTLHAQRVSILGDSYSTYEGYLTPDTNAVWYWDHEWDCTDVRSVRQTWWHQLLRETGMKLCVNNSFSGATICYTGYDQADYSDRSFCTRLSNLGSPDIILIFGATNDEWAHSPIGAYQYEGWKRQDLYSFRPAMAYMLEHLIDHYPNVQLYFILNDILSDTVNESVLTICRHYDVPVIRLHDIDKQCGHPNVKGMQQICEQVKEVLKQENAF